MPNRARTRTAPDLSGRRRSRDGLTQRTIVAAAIGLADDHGLEAVSIRGIAAALGARPMSLYTHITGKEELLQLMGEEIVAEVILPPPLPDGWRAALTAIATCSHRTFLAHPWLPSLAAHRPHLGANALRHAEQLLGALDELDLEPQQAWQILYAINDLTLGHAIRISHANEDGDSYPRFPVDQFPHLPAALSSPPLRRDDATFKAGLDLLLAGIAERYGHHRSSR
jgi:AcrR family transcriptional regulator